MIVLIIVLVSICCPIPIESFAGDSVPTWFMSGIYAEYRFDSGGISFLNGTFFSFPKDSPAKVIFRWECIYTTENISRLNVTLSFSHETRDFWFSTMLDVNVKTRRVALLNGTYVGMTFLRLPSNLEDQQTITITDEIMGNVSVLGFASSPQGLQKAFWVTGTGEIEGHLIVPGGGYDLDTGVLLESGLWGEPALLALGILNPGVVGRIEFTATNIDLGPRKPEEPNTEPLEMLLIALPIGTFALAFLAVFWRRRRKRKR